MGRKSPMSQVAASSTILVLLLTLLLPSCGTDPVAEEPTKVVGAIRSVAYLELAEMELTETFVIRGSGNTLESIRTVDEAAKYIDNLLRPGDRVGVYSYTHTAIAYLDLSALGDEAVQAEGTAVPSRCLRCGCVSLGALPRRQCSTSASRDRSATSLRKSEKS